MVRSFGYAFLTFGLVVIAACSRPIDNTLATSCADARDCSAGQVCSAGSCTDNTNTPTGCFTDLDCSADGSSVCESGLCTTVNDNPNNGGCTTTADCSIDQFCNTQTGLCSPLLENWCRVDSQCTADVPVCSNRDTGSGSPGRCLQCITAADCDGGAACNAGGVCATDTACPTNATAVGNGTCRCNIGFTDDGAGGCVELPTTGEGEGEGESPIGGEGEGEGESPIGGEGEGEGEGDFGGSCSDDYDCWDNSGNINTMCDPDFGECTCDVFYLWLTCEYAYDASICECVDEGGGGSSGGCGDITYEGECQGNTAVWCEEGELYEENCGGSGCGYQGSSLGYYCY